MSTRSIRGCLANLGAGLLVFLLPVAPALATVDGPDISIGNYQLVSGTRVGRTTFEYVYHAVAQNNGATAYTDVAATATSSASATTMVDGDLSFGDVAANGSTTSSDTFTIRQDRRSALDWNAITWNVTGSAAVADADGDGISDATDICPNDATNTCITITGQVFGGGAALAGASITIGSSSVQTASDDIGEFTATGIGPTEIAEDNLNDFFPVEVKAPGYSTGYAKVAVELGKTSYEVRVDLQPVTQTISATDDVTAGVEINKGGTPVGSLTIPSASLPTGVTGVTGTVTYLDPTAGELQSAPGGDLLAVPEGADPNATPTPLQSYGMMEFDLKDQDDNPITTLSGDAEVCMKATPGLSAGDTIALWWYDESVGLWKGEGQGTVVDRNGQLMICGNVTHFTWWNYDHPIDEHSCFKFDFRDRTTGNRLSGIMTWQAEGVTYDGISPERACNSDSDDPVPNTIDSLTVKRTTDASSPEQIRVFTYVGSGKYYLVRDGDGAYSLSQNVNDAAVFDAPAANGSCLTNFQVENCAFLDYQDTNPDGILYLSSDINYPPLITNFTVEQTNLQPGASMQVSADVIDPEGESPVMVAWSQQCGWDSQDTGGSIVPATQSEDSASTFSATFTAPSDLSYPYNACEITLTATDADGQFSTAQQWVLVTASTHFVVQGIVYGTDAQPLPNLAMQYRNYFCDQNPYAETQTDDQGNYQLDVDLASCVANSGYFDSGYIRLSYEHNNTPWSRDDFLPYAWGYYGDLSQIGCQIQPDASITCQHDIRLPTVWADLQGNLYLPQGQAVAYMDVYRNYSYYSYYYSYSDYASNIPLDASASTYGPISVPLGELYGYLYSHDSSYGYYYEWDWDSYMPSTAGLSQDIGDASAPVTVKVLDDQGNPLVGGQVSLSSFGEYYDLSGSGYYSASGATDEQGEFTAADVPIGSFTVGVQDSSGTYSYYYWGGGYVTTKDKAVYVDLNSPETCTVAGTAYDLSGLPLSSGVPLYAYAWSSYNTGNLQTTTEDQGHFTFTGVAPGGFEFLLYDGNSYYYSSYWYYLIDNCRPTAGQPREIRLDRPPVGGLLVPSLN